MTIVDSPTAPTGGDLPVASPAGGPTVLISSRDGAPVPEVRGAQRLANLAEQHGWRAVLAYALAEVPDLFARDGSLRKARHQVHTVSVRISRDGRPRGWATYRREDDGPWRFWTAGLDGAVHSYRSLADRLANP